MMSAMGADAPAQTPADAAASPSAVPAYRQANKVAILTVSGVIDGVTLASLERRMKRAVEQGADAIVLDINTPGGDMLATLDICNLLKDRTATPANVVAWIHPTAYSAGTIMSLACREIIVSPGSTFGDAAPIQITAFGGLRALPPTERAKIEGPLVTELLDSARRNHYDERLVQAFAKLGDGLWLLENTQTGERIFVDLTEYRLVFGDDPPQMIGGVSLAAPLPTNHGSAPLRPLFDHSVPRPSDIAGLNPQQAQRELQLQQSLPAPRSPLTRKDRDQWQLVRQVVDSTSLLTLKADEAVYYGVARAVAANDAEIASYFGTSPTNITRYDQSWSESLVRFLISWPVKLVLIIVFLVCLFIELAVPGFGVFGLTAAVALLILIGAPALAGMAQWWEILLIVLGLLLVAAELFLIPGFGVTGVLGVLCLLVGLVGTFVSGDVSSSAGQGELWTGMVTTLTGVFVGGVVIWFLSRQLHTFPLINRLILHTELSTPRHGANAAGGGLLAAMSASQRAISAGDVGTAETDLRPAGRAMIDGRVIDVQSFGTYINKGTKVRVVSVGRYVIEVEEVDA